MLVTEIADGKIYTVTRQQRVRIVIAGILVAFVVQIISPLLDVLPTTRAATHTVGDDVKAYLYMSSLRKCLYAQDSWRRSKIVNGVGSSDVGSGAWFQQGDVLPEYVVHESTGQQDKCENGQIVTGASEFFGYAGPGDMWKDLGGTAEATGGDYTFKGDPKTMGDNAYGKLSAKYGKSIQMDQAAQYQHYLDIFESACAAMEVPAGTQGDAKPVKVVDENTNKVTTKYYSWKQAGMFDGNPFTMVPPGDPRGLQQESCEEIAQKVNDNADGYAAAIKADQSRKGGVTRGGSNSNAKSGQSTCNILGVGWLVCPVLKFMAEMYDNMFDQLANRFLVVQDKLVTSSTTRSVWENFRALANIMFVIAFMFIVYSQVTNMGISNYGVKKLLPKLILAAIMVNLSYWICAIAVDLSNIFGYGMKDMFGFIGSKAAGQAGATAEPAQDLIAGALTLTGGIVLVSLSWGVIGFGLLALGMTLLILILRQALIIVLICIAPLAFVAFLLPNTEKWFNRWMKMFGSLLLLFPIVGVIFGGASMVSKIVGGAGSDSYEMKIIAVGVQALPLFVVPSVLQNSLAAFGTVGARLGNMAGRLQGRAGGSAKKGMRDKYNRSNFAQRRTMGESLKNDYARERFANSERGKMGRVRDKMALTRRQKYVREGIGRNTLATESSEEQKAVDAEAIRLDKQWNTKERVGKAGDVYEAAMRSGNTVQARAAQKLLLTSGTAGVNQLQSSLEKLEGDSNYTAIMASETGQKSLSDISSAGIKGKNNALDTLAYSAAGTKVSDLASKRETYAALNPGELAGQSAGNLERAVNSGAITKDQAQRVLSNENITGVLAENKQKILMKAGSIPAGGATANAAAPRNVPGGGGKAPNPAAKPAPTPSASATTMPIPHVAPPATGVSGFGSNTLPPPPPMSGKPVNAPNERWRG